MKKSYIKYIIIACVCLVLTIGATAGFMILPSGNGDSAAETGTTSVETAEQIHDEQENDASDETSSAVSDETGNGDETKADNSGDVTAPVISGVSDFIVHIGDTIRYKENIVVEDDTDPEPVLTINADDVNLSEIGDYVVVYTAEDASGNISYAAANVTVVAAEKVTLDMANELADQILDGIIEDGMTDSEKLSVVWDYLYFIGYVDVDYGEADDYLENAYHYLTEYQGNCRCSYAASKLLLERLGYKTMMIHNSDDAFQNHYWNLVSVDGGETWYHFDPTCWGFGDFAKICMKTDEWMLEYSVEHERACFDWNRSLYPATPEEEFDPEFFDSQEPLWDSDEWY